MTQEIFLVGESLHESIHSANSRRLVFRDGFRRSVNILASIPLWESSERTQPAIGRRHASARTLRPSVSIRLSASTTKTRAANRTAESSLAYQRNFLANVASPSVPRSY